MLHFVLHSTWGRVRVHHPQHFCYLRSWCLSESERHRQVGPGRESKRPRGHWSPRRNCAPMPQKAKPSNPALAHGAGILNLNFDLNPNPNLLVLVFWMETTIKIKINSIGA